MRTFFILTVLLLCATPLAAQTDGCGPTVNSALTTTAQVCSGIGSDLVCYGHGPLQTVVNCENAPDFASSGDVLPLAALCAVQSGGMDADGGWGLAVLHVRPHNLAHDMTYVLIGDAQIQNAATELDALEVRTRNDVNILSGPGSSYSTLGTLAGGAVVRAHACNCTGNWLRTVMENGQVGWIPSRQVEILGDMSTLPVATADMPVYSTMQALTLQTSASQPGCPEASENGLLIQTPSEEAEVPLRINGVMVWAYGTLFVQSQADDAETIEVLAGSARVSSEGFNAFVPAGSRAIIPMSGSSTPSGMVTVQPYRIEDVATLPVSLLPEAVNPEAPLTDTTPYLTGLETCVAVSNAGETVCKLHFVNRDGDAITQMNVEFLSAPAGTWSGSSTENPPIITGDPSSGVIGWNVSCSLGAENFIGPVQWSATVTDAEGHVSAPFELTFNCIDGQ